MSDYKVTRRVGHAHTLPTAPAWSFGGRQERNSRESGPGPGTYGPSLTLSRGTTFGSSIRDGGPHDSTPGPLEYQPDVSPVRNTKPAYTFGGKASKAPLRNSTPGPGNYEPQNAVGLVKPSSASHTIAARLEPDHEGDRKPGPDAYDHQSWQAKEPRGATLKFRNRPFTADAAVPGPGSYSIDQDRSQSVGKSFGVSRNYRFLDNGVPGPGAYAPADDAVRRSRAAWSVGRASRGSARRPPASPRTFAPEPVIPRDAGHSVDSGHRSSSAYTFGMRTLSGLSGANPGPGDYGCPLNPGANAKPAYSFRGVTHKNPLAKNPGPGAYDHPKADSVVRTSAPAVSISWRHEDPGFRNPKPGPADYDPRDDDTRIGVSLKFRNYMPADNTSNPAPHDYADKDFRGFGAWGSGPKGITMGARLPESARERVPGPQYAVGVSTLGVAGAPELYKSKVDLSVVL